MASGSLRAITGLAGVTPAAGDYTVGRGLGAEAQYLRTRRRGTERDLWTMAGIVTGRQHPVHRPLPASATGHDAFRSHR